ncbi:hypothetical protein MD484_g2853, partial [Candolleomyces efflorescens]
MAAPTNVAFFPDNAAPWQADHVEFNTYFSSPANAGPSSLNRRFAELKAHSCMGAIHDSAERCDAPKCAPETRVAVQDDLYGWIIDGDGSQDQPKKMKWVTGPAGSGKTAIMGSLSKRCKDGGVLGATFFFSSWSGSPGRRRKTAFVTTIAHQLAQYHPDLGENIATAVNENPDVFEKTLETQMEVLVLLPLRRIPRPVNEPGLQGAIIIDGVDECEAEQYHFSGTPESRSVSPLPRTKEQDQAEILQVLQTASVDPSFPFRILIASRPERVFREFFSPICGPTNSPLFSRKVDLHEDYNADGDIALFLEAQLSQIRRRYNLPGSWASPNIIRRLVENASGQFIYAATLVRALVTGGDDAPEALLEVVLRRVRAAQEPTSNPLAQLDALYAHILGSSADPHLSVCWIRAINKFNNIMDQSASASNVNMFLQTNPEGSEAERLLGRLRSLIQIPPPTHQATTKYGFYHKSLLDFLADADRCRSLYIKQEEHNRFIWDRFYLACTIDLYPELRARAAADGVRRTVTRCAHIFSDTAQEGEQKTDYAASAMAILRLFGLDAKAESLVGNVHQHFNILTMQFDLQYLFNTMHFWLEEVVNTYDVVSPNNEVFQMVCPPPARVTVRVDPDVVAACVARNTEPPALPSPSLLAIHAACSRVAHISGAVEQIYEILRDLEDTPVMAEDGGSAHLVSRLLQWSHTVDVNGSDIGSPSCHLVNEVE